jgi:hypothetical protein
VPHTLSGPQKVRRVEGSTELLQILNDLEVDSLDRIPTGDESQFQYLYESSAMFASSPDDAIPRTMQGIGMKTTMFTIFFTNTKLFVAENLSKGQKYDQDYFISDILLEWQPEKMRY